MSQPKLFFTVLVLGLIIIGAFALLTRGTPPEKGGDAVAVAGGGLQIEDVIVGDGEEARTGDTVTVHYTGTFADGKEFDSSHSRGQPLSFTLGAGQVIKGWDQGLLGMKVGGTRKLVVPPELGYGEKGFGESIPPNTTLFFEVELLKAQR